MSEGKQQSWFMPLRMRLRSAVEPVEDEQEMEQYVVALTPRSSEEEPTAPSLPAIKSSMLRQSQQIKELIYLGNVLRAELGLEEVLEQVVAAINSCTGFRVSVIKLINEGYDYLRSVAYAGLSEADQRTLEAHPMQVSQMLRLMRPEFQMSQSYFISHEHQHLFEDVSSVGGGEGEEGEAHQLGTWHPTDMLIVPLFSPRQRRLLGFLSLDEPIDDKVPTEESIEMIELFANQAAIAIDNACLFQEREAERVALEAAIIDLRRDLERVQGGDLRVRVQVAHEKLRPVVEAINLTLVEISSILGTVQMVTQAVDEHTQEVQRHSELLVRDANQQERQVQHISLAIEEMAGIMLRVSENASKISHVSIDAMDINVEGQNQIMRATEGMRQVREVTMQSSRVIKRLGESGQEINDTVAEISDLTTRMNLLALNAAIEAVRAGDQGQGFVVIAQEMRSLAVHSAEAARKVSTRLRTIQQETATVSQSVEQNIQKVVMQSELVAETGAALDAIGIVTAQMSELVQEVCDAAESQAHGSRRVAYSVEEISSKTSEITEHMLEMQQSMAHLVELTNTLRSRVSVFHITDEL
ncbi:MAG: methyl-accepting chemotaxis protein [Ktedonobacteraceae bacterium]